MANQDPFAPIAKDPQLIEKLNALRAPFPPEKISHKPKGGAMLSYVGHADITERLLDIDPFWEWKPCRWHDGVPEFERDKNGRPVGLWIVLTVCGVHRLGYGSVEATAFDAEKQLIGDALRNAAMRFGVALELWSKSEKSNAAAAPSVGGTLVPGRFKERSFTPQSPDPDAWMGSDGPAEAPVADEGVPLKLPDTVFGVTLGIPYDETKAMSAVMPFGKHKGMSLAQISGTPEGAGYLKWMVNNIKKSIGEGKPPSPVEQQILIVAHYTGVVL